VAAFDELFVRLAPRVMRMMTAMARDRARAEDLTQTTFLKVHRARASYQPGASVETWVFTIARRTFVDEWRADQRNIVETTADGELPELAAATPSGLAFAERRDLHALLDQSLASMPANQSEALMLLKGQGLSMAEAAAAAGTSVAAMKVRAHRAYGHLRRYLSLGGTA